MPTSSPNDFTTPRALPDRFRQTLKEETYAQANALLSQYPHTASEYWAFVDLLVTSHQVLLARMAYDAAVLLGFNHPFERIFLAQVLWVEGRTEESAKLLNQLFRESPKHPIINRHIARVLIQTGQAAHAIPRLQVALEADPDDARLHYELGMACLKCGRIDDGEAASKRVRELEPDASKTHSLLASIQWELGHRDSAFAHGIRAYQLDPKDVKIAGDLAKMLHQCGVPEAARDLLIRTLRLTDHRLLRQQLNEIHKEMWQASEPAYLSRRLASSRPKEPFVVFVCDDPRVRQAKLAAGLRAIGWKVVLLHRRPTDFDVTRFFDESHRYLTEYEALTMAREYHPMAFHVFSPWYDETTTTFVEHKPGKVVYDYTDVFTEICSVDAGQGIASQRFCIEEADGVCCRDLRTRHAARSLGWKHCRRTILFADYCWDDLFAGEELQAKRSDGIHLVSIGSFGVEKHGEMDNGYLGIAERFARNGIHFHIYPVKRQILGSETFEDAFSDYLQLGERTGFVHMHQPVPIDQVIPEISQYHIGLSVVQALTFHSQLKGYTEAHFKYCGSTRIFDYLDAGLPVVMNREFMFQYHPFARYGLAIEGNEEILNQAGSKFREYITPETQERVKQMREHYSLKYHAPRLARFYESLWNNCSDTRAANFTNSMAAIPNG